ncbi:MAG: PAS domain S-box protein [Nitrospirae bacterium]|nr:MAG: PAS domain S-box protein [Nitrospirota bacterium]
MNIGQKFTLWVSVVVVVIGLFSGFIFYHLEMHQELDVYESMGRKMGPILEQSIISSMMTRQRDAVQKIFQDLAVGETITGIHLIDKDRTVRAGTDKALLGKTISSELLRCHGCHERGQGGLFYRLQDNVRYVQHLSNRTECHGCHDARLKFNGVIIFDFSVSEVARHIRREMILGYLIFIPTLFVVGLMTIILSRQLVQKRIEALNAGVRSMREGNYSARLPLRNDDEITRFSEAFNDMAGAISERNQEKDLLLKQVSGSFEMWQSTFDSISDLITVCDSDGFVILANRAYQAYYGLSAQDLAQSHCMSLIAGRSCSNDEFPVSVTVREQRMASVEMTNQKTGEIFQVTTYPFRPSAMTEPGFIMVARDITLQKTAERTYMEQFEFLRTMMDTIPNPVFYKDAEGRYLGCNRAFEEFLGRSKDEIIGKTVYDMGPKEIADLYYRADRELFSNPGQQCYEWRVLGKNKEVREVIFNKATFPDATGRVAGLIGIITDITQRKRAEEALRESEAKFRTIFENSLDAIRVAKNGIYDYANPSYLALFGYSRQEELSGQAVLDMIALSERPQVEKIMQQRIRGEDVPSVYATRGIRRDGTEFDMEVRVSLYTVSGDVFTVANIRDISDRKRHEEIIRHNYDTQTVINTILKTGLKNISLDEILQETLDIILSLPWLSVEAKGCIFLLEEGKKTLVMKAMKGLSECVEESCMVVPLGKCLCGRAALSEEVVYASAIDERHELCLNTAPPHGHYCIPILLRGKALGVLNLYLSEGHARDTMEVEFLDAVAGTLAGIITRKRTERERERLMQDLDEALYKVIKAQKEWISTFDSITDMIAIIDRDFIITRVNKAFAHYFGMVPQEVLGKKCHDLVHEQGTPIGICPHLETLRHHHTSSAEVVDHKRQRTFKVTTFPFYSPQGDVIGSIHISRDITEERNKELRLILNERLASLGQMASGIAHEINNPLAAIGGCAEGLLNRTRQGRIDPELFENYLQIIQEEVMRCSSITGGMLSIVRQSSYETRILNLNELLHKTIELVNFQGRLRSVQVLERYADALPPITGNEGELKQAFLAIITNALDAMEDSGTLTVETSEKGGRVVVSIEDTGCGIPEEHLGRIFDPFFTLRGGKGGTGLGLSIANKIVGNHQGEISVSSEEGRGTVFTISFAAEKTESIS